MAETQVSALLESTSSPEGLHLAALIDATRGRHCAAVELLRVAVAAEPLQAPWHCDLGFTLLAAQQPESACAAFAAALALDPLLARARRGLARALAAQAKLALDCWRAGDLPGALHHARAVVSADAASPQFFGIFLYLLLFDPAQTGASLRAAHQEWTRRFPPALRPFTPASAPDSGRRLRVGYLSGEFFGGPPVLFLAPLLAAHDRQEFEIFLYHTSSQHDQHTEWFRGQACQWRECHALSDANLLDLIRHDQIDILIDPSGYSADHRLSVFAQRAAPLQVAYPSYPSTRGIPNIDFILTDQWATPPGTESQYVETVVRLPSGYLSYVPPPDAPPLTPLPALENGYTTFGMFQRRTKLNPAVFDVLAEVLRQCPGSQLLIQHDDSTLDDPHSPSRENLIREFLLRGIPESRVRYYGARPRAAVMALMAETDVVLDTFPFAGQTTTCESLWMGVPVVSLAGDTHASRVGASLLAAAGLSTCVASTPAGYVAIALRLASDVPYLVSLRQELRQRLVTSGFVDSGRLASETETALRELWRQWCLKQL